MKPLVQSFEHFFLTHSDPLATKLYALESCRLDIAIAVKILAMTAVWCRRLEPGALTHKLHPILLRRHPTNQGDFQFWQKHQTARCRDAIAAEVGLRHTSQIRLDITTPRVAITLCTRRTVSVHSFHLGFILRHSVSTRLHIKQRAQEQEGDEEDGEDGEDNR
jgi:hypothetical protein